MKTALLVGILVLAVGVPVRAADYEIDAVHSSVGFKIRHMVVAKTTGKFKDFSGTVHFEPGKPKTWKVSATIAAASIDTGNEKRDAHLRGGDFFDVEKYPTIRFVSTKVTDVKEDTAKLHGDLTMHGVTNPIVLDLEINGTLDAMAGFTANTTLDRTAFGIKYNRVLDAGGLAIGNEVKISLEIEAAEPKPKN